jgi:hypothetical protein
MHPLAALASPSTKIRAAPPFRHFSISLNPALIKEPAPQYIFAKAQRIFYYTGYKHNIWRKK